MTPLFATPLLAFLVSLLLHGAALRLFPRIGLLDFPERYGHKRRRLPYPTGILSVATFLLLFPLLFPWSRTTAILGTCVVILAGINVVDDRRRLSPLLRLVAQATAAFALFATGVRIYSLTNPFPSLTGFDVIPLDRVVFQTEIVGSLPLWSGAFTIVWLLLTMNALNWFDGIPGQVSALSGIGFLTIGILSLSGRVNQPEIAAIALTLSALALAGLLFDFPPNKVLMGDTGSMFFGLLLGVLTIYSGGKVATSFLVLGVPLIDLLFVMVRRIVAGKSPIKGSASGEHLHHRLLEKGWSPRQVILLTAGLGGAFGVTALFLSTLEKFLAGIVLMFIMLGLSWYSRPRP